MASDSTGWAPAGAEDGQDARLRHVTLALAYALRPQRIAGLGGIARLWLARRRAPDAPFPLRDPARALRQPDGLVDVGPALTPDRVLGAYAQGVYPFCHLPPMKWWAPHRRALLPLTESRIEKNLRRTLRKGTYRMTFDTAFGKVMRACAAPRQGRYALTWISRDMVRVFSALHEQGHAHSVEAWDEHGTLVGGLYGLAMGRVFFTESQFATARDASKASFVTLNRHLAAWGFSHNDGKAMTGHLASLGMREMTHDDLVAALRDGTATSAPAGRWQIDPALDVASWDPAA